MAGVNEHLIPHYVRYLRDRSHLATEEERYSELQLAAHLFAIANELVDDGHDLRRLINDPEQHESAYSPDVDSLEELGSTLAQLPLEISARNLYLLLIDSLSLIEAQYGSRLDADYESISVDIPEIRTEKVRRLGGHVIVRRGGTTPA